MFSDFFTITETKAIVMMVIICILIVLSLSLAIIGDYRAHKYTLDCYDASKESTAIEIAKNMLDADSDIEFIARVTKLDIDKIRTLAQDTK